MSLINDALRKARATQPVAGRMAEGPALKPLSAPRTKRTPILTLALAIAVLALAGGLLWAWYHAEHGELVARANTGANATTVGAAPRTSVAPAATPTTATSTAISPTPAPTTMAPHGPVIMRGQIISQTPPAIQTGAADAEVHPLVVPTQAEIQPGPVRKAIVRLNPNTPKPAARTYKLEGIFYSPKGPSAVIDGDLVYVGSEVPDGKVVAIDNESATVLTTAGETNVLVLIR
jgi:PQQ-like domain